MKVDLKTWKVSDATRKRNPHLFPVLGGLQTSQPEPTHVPPLASSPPEQGKGPRSRPTRSRRSRRGSRSGKTSVVATIIAHRRRLLDSDNNVGSIKGVRDAVAKWIGLDDGDPRWIWEYGQIQTSGREGVSVKIEVI